MPRPSNPPPNETIVIAEIREYGDFTAAIRKWILELDTTYECIDEIAGLQDRYLSKLIQKSPVRNFGPGTLSCVLGALGVKLLLAIDTEQLAKLRPRYVPRRKHACGRMLAMKRHNSLRFNAKLAQLLAHRRTLLLTPSQRKEIARKAARLRWGLALTRRARQQLEQPDQRPGNGRAPGRNAIKLRHR